MPIPFEIINLDKPRRLRFGAGAIIEFEKTTGIKLRAMDNSPDMYFKALWVMLKQDEPTLTLADVCQLVDDYADNVGEVILLIDKVLSEVFPEVPQDPNLQTPTKK